MKEQILIKAGNGLTRRNLHGVDVAGGANLAPLVCILDATVHDVVEPVDEGQGVTRTGFGNTATFRL